MSDEIISESSKTVISFNSLSIEKAKKKKNVILSEDKKIISLMYLKGLSSSNILNSGNSVLKFNSGKNNISKVSISNNDVITNSYSPIP